ncbi:MAG: DUF6883 domain-containing protein [Candidatus Desantisbacteria bacterium]
MVYIGTEKLRQYLLSMTHPVGKSKAKLLRSIGFNESNVNMLKKNLVELALKNEVVDKKVSVHGTKYVIDGNIQSPDSIEITLRTVWIIDNDENILRFITAYPL